MHIKNRIKSIVHKIRNNHQVYVNSHLCGVPLQLLPGTIRGKVDQDDTWWFYLAKHHSIIFDVGCNIGYTALLALIQDPNRQILLVDPNPIALQKAAMNLIQNNLGSRAYYLSAFVGEHLGDTIKFYTIGSGAAGSMHASHAESASAMNSFMEVKTVTLDYLYDLYNIQPDLVKIDVEGAETLVMKSAKKLARETKCTFFIEMHDVEGLGMEAAGQMLLDWCKDLRYKSWYLKTGTELKDAHVIKERGKCHLLLMSEDKTYPAYLKGVSQNATLPETI